MATGAARSFGAAHLAAGGGGAPVASRCEAGLVTLAVARTAGLDGRAIDQLETQLKRALAFLLRRQVRSSSPRYRGLLADPDAVEGAFPASEVDWTLRVDFAQHAGSALLAAVAGLRGAGDRAGEKSK